MRRVAIVGAGAGGLAAAYDLAKASCKVTVFEAADYVGGLASGFRRPNWDWSVERYYHHWFETDRSMLDFIEELGWSDDVLFPWPITAVFFEEKFHPLDGPISKLYPGSPWLDDIPGAGPLSRVLWLLRYPGLSLAAKLRSGLVGVLLLVAPTWRPFERVSAHEWLRKWMGESVYRELWQPLLVGKFGSLYQEVNAAWFWARVKARSPRLGTFVGGFQAFLDRLADEIRGMGAEIRLQAPVESIRPDERGGLSLQVAGERRLYDQCLVTTSPGLLAKLTPDLPRGYTERLLSMKSMGAVVMVIALKHQLSREGVYWHNLPKEAGFPFLALTEHTNFLPPEHFGGEHIIYCGDYLHPDHDYFRLTKEELLEKFLAALPRFNPEFKPDWVIDSWLFRTPYAQPVPPINHSHAIPDLKTPMPGLWLASMSQVYPWDRGTNFAVQIARRAARRMLLEESQGTVQ